MKNKKMPVTFKKYCVLFGVLGVLASMTFMLTKAWAMNALLGTDETEPYVFADAVSPDRRHSIQLIAAGKAVWPFGPQEIHIRVDGGASELSTSIDTDGADLKDHDIQWEAESAYVVLEPESSVQQAYRIEFSETGYQVECFPKGMRAPVSEQKEATSHDF